MIIETMVKQNVNQADLCAGLCSTTAFSRYIRGERHMDRLMLTVILQRLGKSADKFTTLLSHEEYVYFAWKQKVYVAQFHKEWEKVKELLQQEEALDRSSNEVLQELSAILYWQNLQPDEKLSMRILGKLVNYTEPHFEDLQEKSKIYPKAAAQYLPFLYGEEKYPECLTLAQNLQYVEEIRYILEKGRGEISVDKRFNRLTDILAKTISDVSESMDVKKWPPQFWKRILSEREMSILLKVADAI